MLPREFWCVCRGQHVPGMAGMGTGHFGSDLGCVFDRLLLDSGLGGRGLEAHWAGFSKVQETCVDHSSHRCARPGVSGLRDFEFHFKVLLERF